MTFTQGSAYPEQSQATTILVLGILGIICCGPLGIAAWIMGNNELEAIGNGRRNPEGRSTANAGRVMGIIASVLMILGFLVLIGLLIFGVSLSTLFDRGF
jgi:ABC-type Fe3+ transport system permease subunit